MKRQLILTAFLGLFILCFAGSGAQAGSVGRIWVDIDFAFYAGEMSLPAGGYWFEMRQTGLGSATGSTLVLRSDSGKVYQLIASRSAETLREDSGVYLLFYKIGGKYFLSQVHNGPIASHLYRSRVQKEQEVAYSRESKPSVTKVVIASSLK